MYNLGVDIGGMSIKCALVDFEGRIFGRICTIPTTVNDADKALCEIAELCRATAADNNVAFSEVKAVGIGVPGTIDRGVVSFASNLGWYDVDACGKLTSLLNVPVYGGNDANCAAIAEWKFGAGKGCHNMTLITLGTGVGTGFIIDDRLLVGNRGAGTEGGHIIVKSGGKKCNCGLSGCWERYAATTALLETVTDEVAANPQGMIAKIAAEKGGVDGKTVFYAADLGDSRAKELIDAYVNDVALGIINLVNLLRPEIIVIGGGISKQGRIVNPLEGIVNGLAYGGELNPYVKVKAAQFGNDAGIIGAAVLTTL